jgi:hypothetical protein
MPHVGVRSAANGIFLEAPMSVAGIFGSSLFANAVSQVAQKLVPAANQNTGSQSVFGALQQKLLESGSNSSAGGTSPTGQLAQIGQDLASGNLPAAQADFTAFKTTLAQDLTQALHHSPAKPVSSAGNNLASGASGEASLFGAGSDPLAAAMLAYGSLQQGSLSGALSASAMPVASTFSASA